VEGSLQRLLQGKDVDEVRVCFYHSLIEFCFSSFSFSGGDKAVRILTQFSFCQCSRLRIPGGVYLSLQALCNFVVVSLCNNMTSWAMCCNAFRLGCLRRHMVMPHPNVRNLGFFSYVSTLCIMLFHIFETMVELLVGEPFSEI
jgi:hypothetical protein